MACRAPSITSWCYGSFATVLLLVLLWFNGANAGGLQMEIVVASMVVFVLAGVGVLVFAFALHVTATSPQFRARVRRWVFAAAVQFYAARRTLRQRLQPVAVKIEQRLRARGEPEVEKVPARSSQ